MPVAQLNLIGNYIGAIIFTSTSDGHGGTLVTDPPVSSGQSYVVSH